MKNKKITVGIRIIIWTLILAGFFLSIFFYDFSERNKSHPVGGDDYAALGFVYPLAWRAAGRMKGYGEPVDAVGYYSDGLGYEQQEDYKRAIENYDIYSKKIGRRRPEVYARALYYSGKRQESARDYFAVVVNVKAQCKPIDCFKDGILDYEWVVVWLNNVIAHPEGIPGPFTTIGELIQFLNEEENAFLRDNEQFEETINYLKGAHDYQQAIGETKEKILMILQTKFNSIPEDIEEKIRSTDWNLTTWKGLAARAASCESLEEMKKALHLR